LNIKEGWQMYIDIQDLKRMGLNKSQISRKLDISRPTVDKYLKMTADEYNDLCEKQKERVKKADRYKEDILSWLHEYPDLSSAQVYDWLEEKHEKISFGESTLRNYIHNLRIEYNIPKDSKPRDYESVEDPPMGKQMQVDFGQIKTKNSSGKLITLYVMAFVMSHSRHKYGYWQTRPFTTSDIIQIHEDAFEFYGGMPKEIVYDQDSIILVSENHGDLIYTHKFAAYKAKRKFKVFMCRKSDPESKGRIENVIKFIKYNFARHRIFYNIDRWNEDFFRWLERRGNGKRHETTKKIPAEVFAIEKQYLRLVKQKINNKIRGLSIPYQVRKDNSVPIDGNRYSVPRGTYKGPDTYVKVKKVDNKYILILDFDSEEEICRFEIPIGKGKLRKNNNHKRDNTHKISKLMSELSLQFSIPFKTHAFFESIREIKPRYIRDQLSMIRKSIKDVSPQAREKALDFCINNKLYSSVDFNDAVNHFGKEQVIDESIEEITHHPLSTDAREILEYKPQVRGMADYEKALNSNK